MAATTQLSFWRRPWAILRHSGPFYLVTQLLNLTVPRRVFDVECFEIFACELEAGAPNAKTDAEVRWATDDDLTHLAALSRFRDRIAEWLDAGARAVILVRNEMLVACLWIATGHHNQDDWLTFRLRPDEAWTVTVWVHPEHRGLGYHARLWAYGTAALAAEGYRRIFGHINILNRSSRRAFAKAGAAPVRRVFALRLFGWTLLRCADHRGLGRWNSLHRFELWPGSPTVGEVGR